MWLNAHSAPGSFPQVPQERIRDVVRILRLSAGRARCSAAQARRRSRPRPTARHGRSFATATLPWAAVFRRPSRLARRAMGVRSEATRPCRRFPAALGSTAYVSEHFSPANPGLALRLPTPLATTPHSAANVKTSILSHRNEPLHALPRVPANPSAVVLNASAGAPPGSTALRVAWSVQHGRTRLEPGACVRPCPSRSTRFPGPFYS